MALMPGACANIDYLSTVLLLLHPTSHRFANNEEHGGFTTLPEKEGGLKPYRPGMYAGERTQQVRQASLTASVVNDVKTSGPGLSQAQLKFLQCNYYGCVQK